MVHVGSKANRATQVVNCLKQDERYKLSASEIEDPDVGADNADDLGFTIDAEVEAYEGDNKLLSSMHNFRQYTHHVSHDGEGWRRKAQRLSMTATFITDRLKTYNKSTLGKRLGIGTWYNST